MQNLAEVLPEPGYLDEIEGFRSVEELDELKLVRPRAESVAWDRIAESTEAGRKRRFEEVNYVIEANNDAHRYLDSLAQFGPNDPRTIADRQVLRDNCQKAVHEAARKWSWELFEPFTQDYGVDQKAFKAGSRLMRDAVYDGLTHLTPRQQQEISVREFVENATHDMLPFLPIKTGDWLLTISPSATHKDAKEMGYVPSIDKFMIREVRLVESGDDEGGVQKEVRQIAVPGTYITLDIINEFLMSTGVVDYALERHEMVGQQIIVDGEKTSDLIEVLKVLDDMAGGTYIGEQAEGERDYESIEAQAEERQAKLEYLTDELFEYSIELALNNADPFRAKDMIKGRIDQEFKQISRHDPEFARECYDDVTADLFQRALEYEYKEMHELAQEARAFADEQAPPLLICEAGSCNLKDALYLSQEVQDARKKGLSGKLLEWSGGRCKNPNCESNKVANMFKKSKIMLEENTGKKACTSCDAADMTLSDIFGRAA